MKRFIRAEHTAGNGVTRLAEWDKEPNSNRIFLGFYLGEPKEHWDWEEFETFEEKQEFIKWTLKAIANGGYTNAIVVVEEI